MDGERRTGGAEGRTYLFDYDWEQGRRRIELLEAYLDPPTFRRMEDLGTGPGWSCLEVGAGGGSVTRWLAERAGPEGRVVAVDLDTRFLEEIEAPNLEVRRADITAGGLPAGEFDLVHTRALLMHLPERERVVTELVRSLRPGGWLLLEEVDFFPLDVFASGPYLDAWRVSVAAQERAGVAPGWARQLPSLLCDEGLRDVGAECLVLFFPGASPATELIRLTWNQSLDRGSVTEGDRQLVERASRLLEDPGQWFAGPGIVAAWGRRAPDADVVVR